MVYKPLTRRRDRVVGWGCFTKTEGTNSSTVAVFHYYSGNSNNNHSSTECKVKPTQSNNELTEALRLLVGWGGGLSPTAAGTVLKTAVKSLTTELLIN